MMAETLPDLGKAEASARLAIDTAESLGVKLPNEAVRYAIEELRKEHGSVAHSLVIELDKPLFAASGLIAAWKSIRSEGRSILAATEITDEIVQPELSRGRSGAPLLVRGIFVGSAYAVPIDHSLATKMSNMTLGEQKQELNRKSSTGEVMTLHAYIFDQAQRLIAGADKLDVDTETRFPQYDLKINGNAVASPTACWEDNVFVIDEAELCSRPNAHVRIMKGVSSYE